LSLFSQIICNCDLILLIVIKIETKVCQQSINIDPNKTSNENNINLMTKELCIRRNIGKLQKYICIIHYNVIR